MEIKFQVTYIDFASKGERRTVNYYGDETTIEEDIILHYGLNQPDVLWYQIEKEEYYEDED